MKTVTITTMPIQFVLTANNAGTIMVPIAADDNVDAVINNLVNTLRSLHTDVIILENPSRSRFSETVVKIHDQNVDLGIILTKKLHVPVINAKITVDHSLTDACYLQSQYDSWHVTHYYDKITALPAAPLDNGFIKADTNAMYLADDFDSWLKIANGQRTTFEVTDFVDPTICDYYDDLDMQTGQLTFNCVVADSNQRHLQISVTKIIDDQHWHRYALRYVVMPLDFDGEINLVTQLNSDALAGQVSAVDGNAYYDGATVSIATNINSDDIDVVNNISNTIDNNVVSQRLTFTAKKMQTYTFDKMIIVATGDTAHQFVATELTKASFDGTATMTAKYWHDVWNNVNLAINGDLTSQKNIHMAIFNLQSLVLDTINPQRESHLSIAQALTVIPFYIQYAPQRARRLLQCQRIEQLTITDALAIAYDIAYYWWVSYDQDFLINDGLPKLLQIAKKCLTATIDNDNVFLYKYIVNIISQFYDRYENEYRQVAQQIGFSDDDLQQLQQKPINANATLLSTLAPADALLLLWALPYRTEIKTNLVDAINNYWQAIKEPDSLVQVLYASLTDDTTTAWQLWQAASQKPRDMATAAVLVLSLRQVYAGISAKQNQLNVDPQLPDRWQAISGVMTQFGKHYQFKITHYQVELAVDYDANVQVCGQNYPVTPHAPLTLDYAKDPHAKYNK